MVQSENLDSSSLDVEKSSFRLVFLRDIVVSSAYKSVLAKSENLGKSFIEIRKHNGPRQDPCGTPMVMGFGSERASPILTTWVRSLKKLLIMRSAGPLIP